MQKRPNYNQGNFKITLDFFLLFGIIKLLKGIAMEKELFYHTIRKKYAQKLNSMPIEKRVDFLVQKHKKNIQIAKKIGLNTITIKPGELNGQKQ